MMRPISLAELGAFLGVAAPARDASFTGVSTDTRTLAPGDLFVALCGERYDGHDFIDAAAGRGAVGALCQRAPRADLPCLLVPDTLAALGQLGLLNRRLYDGRLVALTGSAGKTTTKEMIAAILSREGSLIATEGNLNNEIGVPLTLLRICAGNRFAVIEMGAGKPGDIRYLAGLAEPEVALLTNALPAHLEGMGSIEGVARTKGEIYDALPATGTAVLNVDDRFAAQWLGRIGKRRLVRVSARGAAQADVRAGDVRIEDGCARFTLHLGEQCIPLALQVPGVQQVANAVAAAGVALALGIQPESIRLGLESLTPVRGRMQRRHTAAGCLVIDDTYNANPGSMRAAIETLASYAGTRVLVIGNMAELGAEAADLHREVGACAREHAIEHLLVTGPHAAQVAEGFGRDARVCATREEIAAACSGFDRDGVVLLVKGSRSAGMETIVESLLGGATTDIAAGRH